MPEARSNSTSPEQAPSPTISQSKTGPGVTTHGLLKALVPDQLCTCATCLEQNQLPPHLEELYGHPERYSWNFGCRVTGCEWTTGVRPDGSISTSLWYLFEHEKTHHSGRPGNYKCREINCKFTTKRFGDLKRHSSSKHCINPQNFKCPDLNCKYHQIGFARKDKLKDHYRNVHEGSYHPGKPNRTIKPKVGDGA